MSNTPLSEKSSRIGNSPGCVIGFGAIFLIAGLIPLWLFAIKPAIGLLRASGWTETECAILECKLESRRGDSSTQYKVRVRYEYEVDGVRYESERYSFNNMSSNVGVRAKRTFVKNHPPGAKAVCFVDPDDPAEAVLQRKPTWDMLFGLIPLVFVVVGGAIVWAGIRPESEKPEPLSGAGGRSATHPAAGSVLPPYDKSGRPVELKTSRFLKFLGITFFALFWNGIVSVFIVAAYNESKKGSVQWFLILFLVPFALIGLLLLFLWLHSLLGLFNPRPRVKIAPAAVPVGGTFRLQWFLSGAAGRISEFRVVLKGEEKATYRRGTKTSTKTEVFFEEELARVTHRRDMRSGRVEATVPEGAMHSVKCKNNEIQWKLIIHGDIKKWPDIEDEFPMVVLPKELKS